METRPARPADAETLRGVHLRSWEETYRGLVSDDVISQRLTRHRQQDWVETLRAQEEVGGAVLALVERSQVIGLCQYGPTEDEDDDALTVGHIHRLYIVRSHQARGGGRHLVAAACEALVSSGHDSATLWVLETDPRARGFYEHVGWCPDGARKFEDDTDIPGSVRYRRSLARSAFK